MTPAEIGPSAEDDLKHAGPPTGPGLFTGSPFTQILDAVPVGLFVLDAAGVPVYSNFAASRILQRETQADATPGTLAESYSAYLAGTDTFYPAERMPIIRALSGEKSSVTDMEIRRGDTITYLEVSGAPVFDANHRVKYAVAVFHDITATRSLEAALRLLADELAVRAHERSEQLEELRQTTADDRSPIAQGDDASAANGERIEPCGRCWLVAEYERTRESAELANRALTLFIANFSHELRTPLNHIIGFSGLIESKIQRGITHDIGAHAETIRASGASLLETLDKIITIAEAESRDRKLSLEILEVNSLIREVAAKFAPLAERNGNHFEVDIAGELGLVQTDAARVRVALTQIIENACKHCRNGSISVAATRNGTGSDGSIEVVVSDTGRGIDPDRASLLVEGRVVPGDSLRDAGLGIGIPLAVQSLRAIGGALQFEIREDSGTCFVLRIPTYTPA